MQDSFYCNYITGLDPDPINKVKFTFDNDYAKNGNFEESADEESCGHTLEPNLEFDFLQDTKLRGDGGLRMIEERDPLSALEDSEDDDSIIIKNFGEQSFEQDFCTKPNRLLPEHPHHQEKSGASILEEKIISSPEYNSVKQEKPKKETPQSSTKNASKGGKIHVKSLKEDKLKQGKKQHSRRTLHTIIEPVKDETLSFSTGSLKRSYTKKSGYKTYNELLSFMQSLSKINWTETDRSSAKLLSSKVLMPSAFWFLTCANYFPRNAFAHKNIKEFVHQRLEKLKNLVPDIPQRLDKNIIKTESIQKPTISESEQEELSKFSKSIKGWVDISRTNEYFERTMSARTVNLVQKSNYNSKDDEWVSEIKTFISDSQRDLQNKGFCEKMRDDIEPIERINLLSKIDLQDLISLYEKNLYQESLDTERRLIELEDCIFEGLSEEDVIHKLNFEPNDSLVDLRIRFPEEDYYLNFLEKKYAEARELAKKAMETETETEVVHHGIGKVHGKVPKTHMTLRIKPAHVSEEYTCQICNDNCLNDEDLIVYCSACDLAVHQTCYGITTIPQGDWICDGCLKFGQNTKYLRCPFCSVRGGAMKPTQLKADTNIFKSLNPNYHAFLKSYVRPKGQKGSSRTSKKKQSAMTPEASETSKSQTDSKENTDNTTEPGMEEEKEVCQDLIEDEPRPKNVWAHITCALFLPELYFKDSVKVTQIGGAENLTKEKFDRQCEICTTSGTGAVVTCAKSNCKRAFHAECARKEKFYLDIKENEQNQMIYHIYCDKHIPLELKRTLENREKQTKQEIESFFKAVEKHLMTVPIEPKASSLVVNSTMPFPQEDKSFIKKKKKHHYKDDIEHFMKQIEKYVETQAEQAEQPQIITLEKINEGEEEGYKVVDMPLTKPVVKKARKLKADDDIWIMMPYKKLTAEQKYKKYKKYLAHMQTQKSKLLEKAHKENITRSSSKEVSTRQSTPYTSKNSQSQSAREIYCVCQRPYKGELMIACEKCGEWYHPKCVGLVDHKNLRKVSWNCPNCSQNGYLNEVNINTNDMLKRPNVQNIDEEGGAYISKKLKTEKRMNTRSTRG